MRLGVPLICFVVVIGLSWAVDHNVAGIMSALPAEAAPSIKIFVGVATWLAAAWVAAAVFGMLVLQATRRRGAENKLPKLLIDVGNIVIFFCVGLIIVSQVFGKPLGGLLATSGVLAALIGFSVQKTIGDMVAGVGLNLEQTIKLGDWIEAIPGTIGKVIEITWRTTHLETRDGRLVVLPNSMLNTGHFTNLNAPQRYLRVTRTVAIDYDVPAERVIRILQAAMEATDGVRSQPEPVVYVDAYGDNGIIYSMNYWVADYPETFTVTRELLVNALKFLDQAGISPVYPKADVTLLEAKQRRIERHIDVASILARTPFFEPFETEALQLIEQGSRLREFPPRAVVVKEGDPGSSLFVVVAGVLDVSKQVPGKPDRRVGRLVAGDLFGEMSLLTGASRSATITAATHSTLIEIDKQQIEPILVSHPEAITRLGQMVSEREAANESILALWPEERQEIARLGVAAFVRAKITQFFIRTTTNE